MRNAFYWVSLPPSVKPVRGNTFDARIEGNTITIDKMDYDEVVIWLDDDMVDLSQPVTIQYDGRTLFRQVVERTEESMRQSIYERKDPSFCFPANVTISKDMTAEDTGVEEIEASLLWRDDIRRIEAYDLQGHTLCSTTQRDEYLRFAQGWNRIHVVKIYFDTFCSVGLRK